MNNPIKWYEMIPSELDGHYLDDNEIIEKPMEESENE